MGHAYADFDWYETPLYYDIIFDTDTVLESNFLEAVYERYVPNQRSGWVVEPACGSGRLVAEMARRGYPMVGFDLSEGALAFAKERLAGLGKRRANVRAELVHAEMQSFRSRRRFDMAYCLVSSFKFLLKEEDALAHMRAMAQVLRSGGIYVLGFHLSEYHDRRLHRERWVASRGDVHVVCNIMGWPPDRKLRRERLRSRLVVNRGGVIKRYQTDWEFRSYDARQFRAFLAKLPEFEHLDTYTFDYDPDEPCELGAERLDQVVILQRR